MKQLIIITAILSVFFCTSQTQEANRFTTGHTHKDAEALKEDAPTQLIKKVLITTTEPETSFFTHNISVYPNVKDTLSHHEIDTIENNFFWQKKYYKLKEKLRNQELQKAAYTGNFKIINSVTKTDQEHSLTDDVIKELKKLKFISLFLIIGFVIAMTFLLLIYVQRKNRIEYTKNLEEKNIQIQIQNDAILDQKKSLEETNKVKDRLFSIVSHDLKDSVSSIKGFIDLLKDNNLSIEEFYECLPELSENADNASVLLYNLLNWSKTQMKSLTPKPELFNIQDVFQEKIKLIEKKTTKKQITLIDLSEKDFVMADKNMVQIVIQNLLTNAVKFCRVGDKITISNISKNGEIIICIKDSGVGISKENIAKLFKKSTFSTNGTCNEKGTGLGLTICKELVQLNKGEIWVKSELNIGSQFFIKLPKKRL